MYRKTFISILFLFLGFILSAQGIFEQAQGQSTGQGNSLFKLNGFARGMAWGASEQSDYSSLFGELALKGNIGNQKAFLKADIRFREGLFMGERKTLFEVKEAFAGYQGSFVDFYVGNQIVQWGRTDGFNPTNNLSPNDYFLLTTDPDDQRLGNFMLRSKIRPFRHAELELVVIPLFKPSVYRYELFDLGQGVRFDEASHPEISFGNSSLAARFNIDLPSVGFSLSYFNGFDPFYGYRLKSFNPVPVPEVVFQPDFYRKQSIGADLALPIKWLILRAEAAYNLTEDYKANMHIPNPDLSYVAGIELNQWGFTAIVQYIGKYTVDFTPLTEPVLLDPLDPTAQFIFASEMVHYGASLYNRKIMNQQEENNNALMASVSKSFGFDVLTIGISGYYNLTSEEYFIRPEVKWKMTDGLNLTIMSNWMKGPEESIFKQAGKVLGGYGLSLTAYF